jgi:hypothetical protein
MNNDDTSKTNEAGVSRRATLTLAAGVAALKGVREDLSARQCDLPDGLIGGPPVQPHLQKYFRSRLTQITSISPAIPPHRRMRAR